MGSVPPSASDTGWQPLSNSARGPRTSAADPSTQAFIRLAVTHALVVGGDTMVTVALAGSLFFSISPTAAQSRVALSLVFTMLPFGVVAPLLGPAIDRSKAGKRIMLAGAAAGRVVAALVMAREINGVGLYPAALALLILSKAHAVAKASLVPGAVRSADDLVEANGKLAMLAAIVGFVAAAPAAGILKLFGGAWVLRTAAVVYAVGAVSALRLKPAPPAELVAPPPASDEAALNRGVLLAATSMAVLRGTVGFLTFVVAFDFRRGRHPAPSWWFGIVLGASLLGTFAGSAIGPWLRKTLKEERILAGTLWLVALVSLVAGRLGSRGGMAMLAFAVGVSAGTGRLAFDAIVQRDRDDALRGRSFARFEAMFQLAWVGAALIPVVVPIPKKAACFVLALATAMAGLSYVSGRRALRLGKPPRPGVVRGRLRRPPANRAGSQLPDGSPPPAAPPSSGSSPSSSAPSAPLALSAPLARSAPATEPLPPAIVPGTTDAGFGPGGVRWSDDPGASA
jgi:hypothetical protein